MYNRSILMGRLTQTPEIKTTPSGKSVTSFSLAVDRPFVKQGEERVADFINCVAWGNTAEFIAKYFGKGSLIHLEGRLQTRTYQAKDGTNRYVTEVVVENASFTGERKNTAENPQQAASQQAASQQAAPQQAAPQQAAPQQAAPQQAASQQAAPQQAAPQQTVTQQYQEDDYDFANLDLPF